MGVPLTWQEWNAIAESRDQTIDRLAQENAELRELVRDMWFWSYCGHIDIDNVLERMHELGVEVDG